MKNLYLIFNDDKKDHVIAEDIPNAIKVWQEFYKTKEEPYKIEFVANYVISRLK